jgi:hypothetical protein
MTFRQVKKFAPALFTDEILAGIDVDLAALRPDHGHRR